MLALGGILISGCATTVVQPVAISSQEYKSVYYQGQVSAETVKELEQRYPANFWKSNGLIIPKEQRKQVAVRLFSSSPKQADLARSVTEMFTSSFVRSQAFTVVEREKLAHLLAEFELNQSGLMQEDGAAETGKMATASIVISGDFSVIGDKERLEARAIDMKTGRILFSEQSSQSIINIQAAHILAEKFIQGLTEILYAE